METNITANQFNRLVQGFHRVLAMGFTPYGVSFEVNGHEIAMTFQCEDSLLNKSNRKVSISDDGSLSLDYLKDSQI